MLTILSVLLALGVHFGIPQTRKSNDSEKTYYQQLGFPSQYFAGEFLSEEEVHYRLLLIYISLMFGVSHTEIPSSSKKGSKFNVLISKKD